jgi:hypothetical protein
MAIDGYDYFIITMAKKSMFACVSRIGTSLPGHHTNRPPRRIQSIQAAIHQRTSSIPSWLLPNHRIQQKGNLLNPV